MVNASWQWTFKSVIAPSICFWGFQQGVLSGAIHLFGNPALFLSVLYQADLCFSEEHISKMLLSL